MARKNNVLELPPVRYVGAESGTYTTSKTVPANTARHCIVVQNLGTDVLDVQYEKSEVAFVSLKLKASGVVDDGSGGVLDEPNYQGDLVITGAKFAVIEYIFDVNQL